jgi:hypothetical protein
MGPFTTRSHIGIFLNKLGEKVPTSRPREKMGGGVLEYTGAFRDSYGQRLVFIRVVEIRLLHWRYGHTLG